MIVYLACWEVETECMIGYSGTGVPKGLVNRYGQSNHHHATLRPYNTRALKEIRVLSILILVISTGFVENPGKTRSKCIDEAQEALHPSEVISHAGFG